MLLLRVHLRAGPWGCHLEDLLLAPGSSAFGVEERIEQDLVMKRKPHAVALGVTMASALQTETEAQGRLLTSLRTHSWEKAGLSMNSRQADLRFLPAFSSY